MFGTLRHDSISNDIVFVNHDFGSSTNKTDGPISSHHTACNKCRAEKVSPRVLREKGGTTNCTTNRCSILQLKCSGEKTGCSRCKTSKSTCVYTKISRGEPARRQRQRQSGSDLAQGSKDARGQNAPLSQERAKVLESPFSRGTQSSQSSGNRNEGNPKDVPTTNRSTVPPDNDHFSPTASSSGPLLDADSIISEFMEGVLPQYESSSMEEDFENPTAMGLNSGEKNLEAGPGPFSIMFQDGTFPLDDANGSYRSHQRITISADGMKRAKQILQLEHWPHHDPRLLKS